jgi:hypothetical protein
MTLSPLIDSSATEALQQSSHPALRNLYVEDTGETLVIKGSVSSYYLKQMAQETLKALQGPRQLVNQVRVIRR